LTLSAETAGNRLNSNKMIKGTLESLTVELLSQWGYQGKFCSLF